MNDQKPRKQIEGHRSAPASPSLSLSDIEGIDTTLNDNNKSKSPTPKSPVIRPDFDELDSDNYESEGVEIEHIYLNNNNNNNNDDNSIHSEININMPESPIKIQQHNNNKKNKKKNKNKNKKRSKRNNRKRKIKHEDHRQAKRIKKEQIKRECIIISDDDVISYSNASISNKSNPIYISSDSDSDSDDDVICTGQSNSKPIRWVDFPSPSPIDNRNEEKEEEYDICEAISNMDINNDMMLNLNNGFRQLNVRIEGNNNNSNMNNNNSNFHSNNNRNNNMNNNMNNRNYYSAHNMNSNSNNNNNNGNNSRRTRRPSPPPNPPPNEWDSCDINPISKKALENDSFCIPSKEMKKLIQTMKSDKHLMLNDINAKNRLVKLIILLLELIYKNHRNGNLMATNLPQILLISPKRHLALEARQVLMTISKFFEINCQTLVGGMPTFECIQILSKGMDVITGTPGKLCGCISKGRLKLNELIAISFNGADELRSMSTQMHCIINALPQDRKIRVIWCNSIVSAHSTQFGTKSIREMDKSITNMTEEKNKINKIHMNKFEMCKVIKQVTHVVNFVKDTRYDREKKGAALFDLLRYYCGDNCIIFFNTRYKKDEVYEYINKRTKEFVIMELDGKATNEKRNATINYFQENGGIFFTTDLMNDNSYENVVVINYDIPKYNPNATYVKRVCSSNARIVFNLVDEFTENDMNQIAREFDVKLISYYEFSRDRRHHRSHRNRSILN